MPSPTDSSFMNIGLARRAYSDGTARARSRPATAVSRAPGVARALRPVALTKITAPSTPATARIPSVTSAPLIAGRIVLSERAPARPAVAPSRTSSDPGRTPPGWRQYRSNTCALDTSSVAPPLDPRHYGISDPRGWWEESRLSFAVRRPAATTAPASPDPRARHSRAPLTARLTAVPWALKVCVMREPPA